MERSNGEKALEERAAADVPIDAGEITSRGGQLTIVELMRGKTRRRRKAKHRSRACLGLRRAKCVVDRTESRAHAISVTVPLHSDNPQTAPELHSSRAPSDLEKYTDATIFNVAIAADGRNRVTSGVGSGENITRGRRVFRMR